MALTRSWGPAAPLGFPGSKGADETLRGLTTHRAMWTQGPWNPSGRAWAPGFLRMLEVRARPTADIPDGQGCLPTPRCHDWSPARPRVRPGARLPAADNLARGPAAGARPPACPAIKTFRPRASAPPAAPLPPLPAASSLGSPRAPSARSGPGPDIPVTGLAFHLRNRDPVIPGTRQLRRTRPDPER